MTIHIFTDDDSADDDMLSMSSVFTGSSVYTGKSSSSSSSVVVVNNKRSTTSNKVAPLDVPMIPSQTPAPSIGIFSDAEISAEMGLGKPGEIPNYQQDSIKATTIRTDKHRRTPDPVLGADELPPRMLNPKIIAILACVGILLLGLVITGLVIVSKNHQSEPSDSSSSSAMNNNIFNRGSETEEGPGSGIPVTSTSTPTSPPTTEPHQPWNMTQTPQEAKTRMETLLEILVSESSRQDLTNSSTDQYFAMQWLAENDPAELDLDTIPLQDIKDRYKAALLYFALSKGRGWRNMYGFLSASPICEWNDGGAGYSMEGIRCENGQVVEVTLDMNHLQGAIPTEIALFPLQSLGLGSNRIGGTIPSELGRLSNLTSINLGSNNLSGTLPTEFSALVSLRTLFLYQNDLQGTIPLSYKSLINLQHLFIEGTSLFGDVDMTFCQRENLLESFFANCAADGSITCTCCTSCCNSMGTACQGVLP